MIRRIDRIATELPPPSEPDPAGAAAVQELLGGRFGELSTFLNYIGAKRRGRDDQGLEEAVQAGIEEGQGGRQEIGASSLPT